MSIVLHAFLVFNPSVTGNLKITRMKASPKVNGVGSYTLTANIDDPVNAGIKDGSVPLGAGTLLLPSNLPLGAPYDPLCILVTSVSRANNRMLTIEGTGLEAKLQRTVSALELASATSGGIVQALADEAAISSIGNYGYFEGTARTYSKWDSRGKTTYAALGDLCDGEGAYWMLYTVDYHGSSQYIPPEVSIVVFPLPTTLEATFTVGAEIVEQPTWEDKEKDVINDLVLVCDGFQRSFSDSSAYRDTSSVATYGLRTAKVSRLDISTIADADALATGFIAKYSSPKTTCKCKLRVNTYTSGANQYSYGHRLGRLYRIVDRVNDRTADLILKAYDYDSAKGVYTAEFGTPYIDMQSYLNDESARISKLENGMNQTLLTSSSPTFAELYLTGALYINGHQATIPSGTLMLFVQSSAPVGWTKQTSHNDKALRVVSGTAGSGGSTTFSNIFATRAVTGSAGSTTLSTVQLPAHSHTYERISNGDNRFNLSGGEAVYTASRSTYSSSSVGSGSGHTHTLSMDAMNFNVQYVDVIIARKD